MNKTFLIITLISSFSSVASGFGGNDLTFGKVSPDNIDWEKVPTHQKVLFFPGKVTYSWLNSDEHRGTRHKNYQTRTCSSCHSGEERGLGGMLVKRDEKQIYSDQYQKNGSVTADIQFAHDSEFLYIKTSWEPQAEKAGRMHDMFQWNGEKWASHGYDRIRMPDNPLYEDRLSFMIDDGSVDGFEQQGCFMSCHKGERDLEPASKEQAQALDVIGKYGLNKNDIRKYLPESRTDGESWDKPKSQEEIDKLKADGQFVDLMQWRSTRAAATGSADDGAVFEYRLFDEGKNVFSWNMNKKKGVPKYMFNKSVTGFYFISRDDNEDLTKNISLIEGVNTMPYDPSKVRKGDIIQGRFLSNEAKGSASDNFSNVYSEFDESSKLYTVVFKRKLNTGNTNDDKVLKEGGVYNFNVAIHDDSTTTRFHFVTFPFNLGIGESADGDINTTSIK